MTVCGYMAGNRSVKMLNDRPSGIFNKLDLSKNPNQSKISFVDQEKSSDPKMLYRSQV